MVRRAHQPPFDPSTGSGTAGAGDAGPSTLRRAQGPQDQGPPFDPSTGSGTAGSGTAGVGSALNCLVD